MATTQRQQLQQRQHLNSARNPWPHIQGKRVGWTLNMG
ncbi:hypothetical protein EV13_2241 [Prochlorococcus sp. MIT 0702]|nr:hypothetical protein EV13_2241 [Prochlorococcus sp. MIT 0702]KGG35473.1 hypothetical protein EV14_0860 [Prochlorococcus sp. MIT 0703]